MDELLALALLPEDLTSDDLPTVSFSISPSDLSDREDLRQRGDRELIHELLNTLQTRPGDAVPLASEVVIVPEHSLLGQWGEVFCKAINRHDFIDWANRLELDFTTLQIRNGVLSAKAGAAQTPRTFTLADESGWWSVANPVIYIAQLLDPAELGAPYLGDRIPNVARHLSLDRVLAFYGYPMPANRLQAQVIIEELAIAQTFPAVDEVGQNRSLIHAERVNQLRDYQQLADALQTLKSCDGLALFELRLQLTSDSLLARTLREAAPLLQATMEENDQEDTPGPPATYYFDRVKQAVCVLPRLHLQEVGVHELRPMTPSPRWYRLVRLAAQLGTDLYPDYSVSAVAMLHAYGLEHVSTQAQCSALIQRLRQWPIPPAPTLYTAARSLDERYIYNRYVGLLNDRYAIRKALYRVVERGTLEGPDGLGMAIAADRDTLLARLEPGRRQLQALVALPEFVAIRAREGIDPASHVLLGADSSIGARNLNGQWTMLTVPVMTNKVLAPRVEKLVALAKRLGGQLRTNESVSLLQVLRLYHIQVPTTLAQARLAAQRKAINAPYAMYESDYWRALKPARALQPMAWTLSPADRLRVTTVSRQFTAELDMSLFTYLSDPVLADKAVVDVRAEADLLLIRLIASPRAQQLANQLAQSLHWYGSHVSDNGVQANRSALVWAALILSLDPDAGEHPARINVLDLSDDYFWGESVAFVRLQVENSFRGLTSPAAALAAHLMLCGQAPYLLARGIPDSMPFLCTQAWVLFQQYATYMERRVPGAARQMSHDELMYLAHLPPDGAWKIFLESPRATPPILGWAVTNGVLAYQERFSTVDTNIAIRELNDLRTRLQIAHNAFASPIVSQRSVALQELLRVYPHQATLEDLVLTWQRDDNGGNGKKYSFVDLYMANRLDTHSQDWHSTDARIGYQQLAPNFSQLREFTDLFAEAFSKQLSELHAAYVEYLRNCLPPLSLPRREALEYGKIEFFALRAPSQGVGRFGLILSVRYYSDMHIYECFPTHLLLRPRRDLDYETLAKAATAKDQDVSRLGFDWPAYARGAEPVEGTSPAGSQRIDIFQLPDVLHAVEALPEPDVHRRRVPRHHDSPRAHALMTLIVGRHFLQGAAPLLVQARVARSLDQISSGQDPWAAYMHSVSLASM